MKKEKGITLIALIVSIIIMLILVAVTITLVAKGGLIDKAKTAKNDTKEAVNEETTMSNEAGWKITNGAKELTEFDFDAEYDDIYVYPTPRILTERVVFVLATNDGEETQYYNFDIDPADNTFSISRFYDVDIVEETGEGTAKVEWYIYVQNDQEFNPFSESISLKKGWNKGIANLTFTNGEPSDIEIISFEATLYTELPAFENCTFTKTNSENEPLFDDCKDLINQFISDTPYSYGT